MNNSLVKNDRQIWQQVRYHTKRDICILVDKI